jgi:phage host-nuclease inhibitor protein Gam
MEDFYYVGMALKKIREKKLYRHDPAAPDCKTWEDWLKANKDELGVGSKRYANDLIGAATLRERLPSLKTGATGAQKWTERAIRPLKKVASEVSTTKAVQVAKDVIAEIEQTGSPITARIVKKHVDAVLGEKPEPPKKRDLFEDVILKWTGELQRMTGMIKTVPDDALELFAQNHPAKAKALASAIEEFEESLQRVWDNI